LTRQRSQLGIGFGQVERIDKAHAVGGLIGGKRHQLSAVFRDRSLEVLLGDRIVKSDGRFEEGIGSRRLLLPVVVGSPGGLCSRKAFLRQSRSVVAGLRVARLLALAFLNVHGDEERLGIIRIGLQQFIRRAQNLVRLVELLVGVQKRVENHGL